jgi:polysaccharide biosynthesis protein PslH
MRILYISKRFKENVCAATHYNAIKEIFGEASVMTVDLRPDQTRIEENYISFPLHKEKWKRIAIRLIRCLQCNTMLMDDVIIARICDIIIRGRLKLVFFDDSIYGKVAKAIKRIDKTIRIITFYHDIEAVLYDEWANEMSFQWKIERFFVKHNEWLAQKYSDFNLVLNERDFHLFKHVYHKDPEGILPMAVPEPDLDKGVPPEDVFLRENPNSRVLLFVGSKYYPNIHGLKWFTKEVFSKLGDNYKLVVIGRGIEIYRNEYASDKRIKIVGGVDRLDPYYNNADIVIAPIFKGGGMKQKIAEAISYGCTLVATTESLLGYEDVLDIRESGKRVAYRCDTAPEFLNALIMIEGDNAYGRSAALYSLYQKKYSLQAIRGRLEAVFFVVDSAHHLGEESE